MTFLFRIIRGVRSLVGTIYRCMPKPIRFHLLGVKCVLVGEEHFPSRYIKRISADLNQRIGTESLSIWFLPTLSWFCSVFQRPQQMARALAEMGCTVIYYEPWHQYPDVTQEGVQERRFIGVRDIAPRLHLLRCPEDLLLGYLSERAPDALLMMWPHQAKFIPPKSSSAVVYEMIDDHSLFSNPDEKWQKIHREWIKIADVMIATADDLLGQLLHERPDTLLLPNGVRIEDWNSTKPCSIPEDMVDARRASVVVGYYGVIAEWFDWNMWEFAAKNKPDWAFVLIGLPYDGDFNKITERTRKLPNIYYLGQKPYTSLANYVSHLDILTIPFVINQITHACSPIKLFEYMAAGKPIVASPMREILKYKSVLIADTPETFVNQLENALIKKDEPEYRLILKQEAEANTWRSRAKLLCQTLESIRSRQKNIPRRYIHVSE